ncbi:MAG: YbaB/EbfC family nucleoid-associated protein [FCB group bacterium]|nr:YbaB/EbfC family nucleoid-associated protein [FCB group bacterium]
MTNILKQAQEVQKRIQNVQDELDDLIIESDAGGGMVKTTMNGKLELLELVLDPELLTEDKELVEDLIISAVNKAITKSQEESQARINSVAGNMLGNMKIPGM